MSKAKELSFEDQVDTWTRYAHDSLLRNGGPGLRAVVRMLLTTERCESDRRLHKKLAKHTKSRKKR